MTDRQLLAEYARSGSERAFAELVGRHAGMVHATCRRVLGDTPAAEDAVQAAFLVLVRKARSLPAGASVAGWLYRTAELAARDALKSERRRARREKEAATMREKSRAPEASWADLRPELDAAIAALPGREQEALVLRYLCGRSEQEVCAELGAPQSTVATRIASALERLRRTLSRRGVALSSAALGGMLAAQAAPAAPAGLAGSIVAVCSGQAAASGAAAALADGTARALVWAKAKLAATALCAAAVVAGGGALAVHRFAPANAPASMDDDPAVIARLAALGEGCSLRLDGFRVLGVDRTPEDRKLREACRFGPGYRHRCNVMPWAADRGTALYCGSNHKSYHVNDVWEFSLGANAWRRLVASDGENHFSPALWSAAAKYGRDSERNLERWRDWMSRNLEVAGGSLRTTGNGGPFSAYMTWDQLAYDRDRGRLYWMVSGGSRHADVKDYALATGQDAAELARRIEPGTTLWWFDVKSRRWSRQLGDGLRPRTQGMGGTLRYVPEAGGLIWYVSAENTTPYEYDMWVYDADANSWRNLAPNGGASMKALCAAGAAPGSGIQSAYSPDHGMLVAVGGTITWTYDCAADWWERSAEDPANDAHDMTTVFAYDRAARAFLLAQPQRGTLRAYDPIAQTWTTASISGPPLPSQTSAGYYDVRLNALVLYDGTGSVWVYRHRRAVR